MGSREDGLQRMEDRHEFIRDIRDGVIINAVRTMLAGKPTKEEKAQRTSVIASTFGLKSADIVAIYNSRQKEDFNFLVNLSERDLAEGVALDLGRAGFSSRARLLGCSEAEIDWMLGRSEDLVFEKLFIETTDKLTETENKLEATEADFKRVKDDRDSLVIQCVDKGDRVRELEEQVKSLQVANKRLTGEITSANAAIAYFEAVQEKNSEIFKTYRAEMEKAAQAQAQLRQKEKEKAELLELVDKQKSELTSLREKPEELVDLSEFLIDSEDAEREHRIRYSKEEKQLMRRQFKQSGRSIKKALKELHKRGIHISDKHLREVVGYKPRGIRK